MLAQEMIGISEAKAKLSALVKRLESGQQERVLLLKQDRPVAVILPIGPYERMVELEERIEFLEDALAVARAEAINDGTSRTLEDVKDRQARVVGQFEV